MSEDRTQQMLDFTQFVTDKFADNHKTWVYTRDTGTLEYVRYTSDYTGRNHWVKRWGRFFKWVTVDYFNPRGIFKEIRGNEGFLQKMRWWHREIKAWWDVEIKLDSNLPDGGVNGIPTMWEEDGEYITMFQPIVGREVLRFLDNHPDHESAQKILAAMRTAFNEGLKY